MNDKLWYLRISGYEYNRLSATFEITNDNYDSAYLRNIIKIQNHVITIEFI